MVRRRRRLRGDRRTRSRRAGTRTSAASGQRARSVGMSSSTSGTMNSSTSMKASQLDRGAVEAQRMRVGVELPARQRPVHERHEAVVDPRLDDLVERVATAVVVQEDVLHAEGTVIGQPLLQVGRLVADDGRRRRAAGQAPTSSGPLPTTSGGVPRCRFRRAELPGPGARRACGRRRRSAPRNVPACRGAPVLARARSERSRPP